MKYAPKENSPLSRELTEPPRSPAPSVKKQTAMKTPSAARIIGTALLNPKSLA